MSSSNPGGRSERGGRCVAWGFVLLLVGLGVFLPLLGVSVLLVLAIENLFLRRIPSAANWLGLRSARLV